MQGPGAGVLYLDYRCPQANIIASSSRNPPGLRNFDAELELEKTEHLRDEFLATTTESIDSILDDDERMELLQISEESLELSGRTAGGPLYQQIQGLEQWRRSSREISIINLDKWLKDCPWTHPYFVSMRMDIPNVVRYIQNVI